METAAALHGRLAEALGLEVAQYAVPLAYRIRFYLHLDAREALHLVEVRTQAGGHPGYRRVCAEMHRLIASQAGHRAIAAAMRFVQSGGEGLGRMEGERRAEERKRRVEEG
jgi:thymidylate synthase ThyX